MYLIEFKVVVIKMFTKLSRRIDEHRENFDKDMENKVPNRSHRAKEYNN